MLINLTFCQESTEISDKPKEPLTQRMERRNWPRREEFYQEILAMELDAMQQQLEER